VTVTVRIPTALYIDAMPIAIAPNAPISATYNIYTPSQQNGIIIPVTISVFVNGVYVGRATTHPISAGDFGNFAFAENLPVGTHYPLTISFAGNAQYGPSTFTGYFNVVTYLTSTSTPTAMH
jgi:hypothetical protein